MIDGHSDALSFHVNTASDFLSNIEAVRPVDFCHSCFVPEFSYEYFRSLVEYLDEIEVPSLTKLEEMLMTQCCKIDLEDSYFMPVSHPVIRLLDEEEQDLKGKYVELRGKQPNMEWRIRHTLMTQYLEQRKEMYVYGTGQVYFIKADSKDQWADNWSPYYRKAVSWQRVGTLTSLDALRLIQKVKIRFRRRGLVGEGSEIHIAYIGDMGGTEKQNRLQQYFQEASESDRKSGKMPSKVLFTRLVRQAEFGEYFFERVDEETAANTDVKRFYNLSSLADMQELFRSFDMVLFLDESYFYKQGQTAKCLEERELKSHIQWCWKELERERLLAEDDDSSFRSKQRYYYKEIYNKAGLWMNGYGKDRSSKLGFDQELFHIMQQAVNEQSDVYIYVSHGKTIGDVDLTKQSVCNDELYDGKRLFVYKLAESKDRENSSVSGEAKELIAAVKLTKGKKQNTTSPLLLAEIDLWKLVKSIGKKFYEEIFGEEFSYHSMEIWKKTYLDIYVDRENCRQLFCKLRYTLDMQREERKLLESFVKAYLKICRAKKDTKHSPYSANYLFDLLTRAMIARAKSAIGIFYAYLLRENKDILDFTGIIQAQEWIENAPGENTDAEAPSKIRGRRVIYSAIKGLDRVIVRDMEKRIDILKYDFRREYCPEIEEDVFFLLLEKIKDYCEYTGYTDSRLYLLTR